MEDFDIFQDDDFSKEADVFADEQSAGDDDDFDMESLRRQSARSGSAFDDIDTESDDSLSDFAMESDGASGGGFSLGNFTPGQRLILAVLVLLDIVAVLFGVLVITGRFSL